MYIYIYIVYNYQLVTVYTTGLVLGHSMVVFLKYLKYHLVSSQLKNENMDTPSSLVTSSPLDS